jgi:hypothetical protein
MLKPTAQHGNYSCTVYLYYLHTRYISNDHVQKLLLPAVYRHERLSGIRMYYPDAFHACSLRRKQASMISLYALLLTAVTRQI